MEDRIIKIATYARRVLHILKRDIGGYESAALNYRNCAAHLPNPPPEFRDTVMAGMEKLMRAQSQIEFYPHNAPQYEQETQEAIYQIESYDDVNWGAEAEVQLTIKLTNMPVEYAKAVCDELESAIQRVATESDLLEADKEHGKGVFTETNAVVKIEPVDTAKLY